MLSVRIICPGRVRDRYINDGVDEYLKRLKAFCKAEICQTSEETPREGASSALISAALEKEGREILSKLPPKGRVIALCVEGKGLSTEELAAYIDGCATEGESCISFIIGSSHGLSDEVKSRADLCLSFSRMTFLHTHMRLLLCEQIYRAFKILAGQPYHK